jgi:ATP-dependent DNA helicase RecG
MLDTALTYLKGVGPGKAKLLGEEIQLFTYGDLLEYFPFRHVDRTRFHQIAEIADDSQPVQVRGILRELHAVGEGKRRRLTATLRDSTGSIDLVWFTGLHWLERALQVGAEYIVYGKPNAFNGRFSLAHPEMEPITEANTQKPRTLQPVYPSTERLKSKGLDSRGLVGLQKELFRQLHPRRAELVETLPAYLLERFRFSGRYAALLRLHFPETEEQLEAAKLRLKFEELFFLQLRLLHGKAKRGAASPGHVFERVGEPFRFFYENKLPFPLTNAQKRVLREIHGDMRSGRQMNRLLQGDVGSGKTVVAFMALLIAIGNGFQGALMAPTEILAHQHYESLCALADGLGLNLGLLTGSTPARQRKTLLGALAEGQLHLLIGTHALLEDWVQFRNLGAVVVDEQHRFGVAQRARLWQKNPVKPPHMLVMTATPIPRTLAMTLYGDLDVSVIDEMPPGRLPVTTMHKYESHRQRVFGMMREQIAKGHQVYVVYPMIEMSETQEELNDLVSGYEAISREFPLPQFAVGIVHGQMKSADKEYEMQRFARRETQILVATTVIEVGVNVPNATIMVIENADRFGLAQLHQLRGRVGRGGGEAICVLVTGFKLSSDARERIKTMCETNNGFEIADVDLRLRGPGNIEGTQQSGIINLRLADLAKDGKVLQLARDTAMEILDQDPALAQPEHSPLRETLEKMGKTEGWGKIG